MAKGKNRAQTEQAATARAEFERKKRQKTLITRGIGAIVLVAIAGSAGYCVIKDRELTQATTTTQYPAGLHVAGTVAYKETPPMGGAHNVIWQNCGVYAVPIHNEHAVHALEHGAAWITYRPDLPADQIERLRTLAADDYMLLSPYPDLPAPVVASSWNHQVALQSANDARLTTFITRYKNNPTTTPEFGAPCVGGTSATATADSLQTGPGPMAR